MECRFWIDLVDLLSLLVPYTIQPIVLTGFYELLKDCRIEMDCRAAKLLYVDRICIFVSLKCACKVRIMERGRDYRIGEDFEHCTILFLVPIILPLNLLPGLQRIVGGFRNAM